MNEVLKEGGRGSVGGGTFGRGHHKIRHLLVIVEVALSLVLLIGAGLLIRTYQHIQNASPGYNPQNILSMRLSLTATNYSNPGAVTAFYKQLCERVDALPGVEAAGISYSLPMSSVARSIYLPAEQFSISSMFLVVRTNGDPASMTSAINREIHTLDPELPAFDLKTMDRRLSDTKSGDC